MTYQQAPPFCIQLEPTEGCNLRCAFCGIAGIRAAGARGELSGPYKFMSTATARQVARQAAAAGWHPRYELAMHGEPTLNPDLPAIASVLRAAAPRSPILLTTNGIPMLDRWDTTLRALYAAGVTTIAVDDYKPYRAREAVLATKLPGVAVYRYPFAGAMGNPHRRPSTGERRLILVQDITEATDGNHSHLSNHAGSAKPLDLNAQGRCALPFREMSIRWDGSVALCCNDWRGMFKLGNVHEVPLPHIWQHPALDAMRRRLYAGRRDVPPCRGCTHKSPRPGLLPDKHGRVDLPPPHPDDDALLAAAVAGASYTPAVARKWEAPDDRPAPA